MATITETIKPRFSRQAQNQFGAMLDYQSNSVKDKISSPKESLDPQRIVQWIIEGGYAGITGERRLAYRMLHLANVLSQTENPAESFASYALIVQQALQQGFDNQPLTEREQAVLLQARYIFDQIILRIQPSQRPEHESLDSLLFQDVAGTTINHWQNPRNPKKKRDGMLQALQTIPAFKTDFMEFTSRATALRRCDWREVTPNPFWRIMHDRWPEFNGDDLALLSDIYSRPERRQEFQELINHSIWNTITGKDRYKNAEKLLGKLSANGTISVPTTWVEIGPADYSSLLNIPEIFPETSIYGIDVQSLNTLINNRCMTVKWENPRKMGPYLTKQERDQLHCEIAFFVANHLDKHLIGDINDTAIVPTLLSALSGQAPSIIRALGLRPTIEGLENILCLMDCGTTLVITHDTDHIFQEAYQKTIDGNLRLVYSLDGSLKPNQGYCIGDGECSLEDYYRNIYSPITTLR